MSLSSQFEIWGGRMPFFPGPMPTHAAFYFNCCRPMHAAFCFVVDRDGATRNLYLVCRMFWCDDVVNSNVCWGTCNPKFNFVQVGLVEFCEHLFGILVIIPIDVPSLKLLMMCSFFCYEVTAFLHIFICFSFSVVPPNNMCQILTNHHTGRANAADHVTNFDQSPRR